MSQQYHTPIPAGAALNSEVVNAPLSQLDQAVGDMLKGRIGFRQINLGAASDLTIADGHITVSRSHHTVDTEAAAATDDLDFIDGGTIGDFLLLRLVSSSRQVRIRDGVGNIRLSGGDITLTSADQVLSLIRGRNNWGVSIITAPHVIGAGGSWNVIVPRAVIADYLTSIVVHSSIPQTYKELVLMVEPRSTVTGATDQLHIVLNDDVTLSHYHSFHAEFKSSYIAAGALGTVGALVLDGAVPHNDGTSGTFGFVMVQFPNYTDQGGARQIAFWQGYTFAHPTFANMRFAYQGGGRMSSGFSLRKIELKLLTGNFTPGTAYSLYGVK